MLASLDPRAAMATGALPFDAGAFDVVTAFNAIKYAVDPRAAVAERARVTRYGGKVAIGVWGDPARCETEALFARFRSLAPPPPGTPTPLGVSKAGIVEGLLDEAGLAVVGGAEVPVPFTFMTTSRPGATIRPPVSSKGRSSTPSARTRSGGCCARSWRPTANRTARCGKTTSCAASSRPS